MSIQILGKTGDRTEVLDDADNKKQATEQVNYWQNLKGKGWKVFSKGGDNT